MVFSLPWPPAAGGLCPPAVACACLVTKSFAYATMAGQEGVSLEKTVPVTNTGPKPIFCFHPAADDGGITGHRRDEPWTPDTPSSESNQWELSGGADPIGGHQAVQCLKLLMQPSHASVVRALHHNENKAVIADIMFGRGWRATGPGAASGGLDRGDLHHAVPVAAVVPKRAPMSDL